MKNNILWALIWLLLLACTGCTSRITDPIYAMVSLRELPVGHVIQESEIKTMQIGISYRETLHPFRPRPDSGEFTADASKIVGHTVRTFIRAHQAISPRRDLN